MKEVVSRPNKPNVEHGIVSPLVAKKTSHRFGG